MRWVASLSVFSVPSALLLRMRSDSNYVAQLDATIQSSSQRQFVLARWCSSAKENTTTVFNAIKAQLSFLDDQKANATARILLFKPQLDKVELLLSKARKEYDVSFTFTYDPTAFAKKIAELLLFFKLRHAKRHVTSDYVVNIFHLRLHVVFYPDNLEFQNF